MKKIAIFPALVIVLVISVSAGAENISEAEQHFEKANELLKRMDYEGAIAEYSKVINLSSGGKAAQDAQYWIGQCYFKAGQFDAALSAFQKLLDEYPASTIIPSTKQMIEHVNQAKKNKSLFDAVGRGDIQQVNKLISQRVDVNARDEKRQTALHLASENGYTNIARTLIANGANVKAKKWEWRNTTLHVAAESGHKDIVELLIAEGIDINTANKAGRTPLHLAADGGHEDVVELLLDRGADANAKDKYEWTPLHRGVWEGHKGVIEALIAKGTDVNAKNSHGATPVAVAMASPSPYHKEIVELLFAKGAKIPALHVAAYIADIEKLKKYLQSGIDIKTEDDFGNTALHFATASGKKDIVEFLIDEGAEVDSKNNFNLTPLYYAAVHKYEGIADLLLANGADANAKDKNGYTLLYYAIWDINKDATELLINKGANVNVKADDGYTLLIHAIWMKDKDIIELLINKGADINAKAKDGYTPMEAATHWATIPVVGTKDFIELLRKHGAKE